MKTVPVTVPLLLWLALSVMPVPVCGQNDAMAEFARRSWADIYPVKSQTNMRIDRVTVHGDLVVYEQFKPASFIIIHRGKDGFILAGYSFGNVFFGGEASGGRPYEILDAVAGACLNDTLRQKGGHNLQTEIGPLLHTRWGQGACFNYFCPRDPAGPGGRVWAGCLAVAMGQIVRYYGKYNSFDFTHEYQSGIYGQLSARLGNYRWEAMDDQPVTIGLEESDLVGDLGVLMHLCYGPSGSTGNSRQALDAFHAIGYAGASMLRKSKFTPESWAEIFYQNLSDYKPMMVTGGGHAFVCDGFDAEGLFHFNLGWDGYGDGWYPLNMVMNLPVNEVFADLEPLSWPAAPDRIGLSGTGDEATIRWNYESGQQPTRSRVYSDDRMVLETTDSLINVGELSPGLHDIFVSAVYDTLESRWIGPVRVFVTGKLLVVHDQLLYRIFLKELGRTLPDIQLSEIFEGDLSRIESIEIDQPVLSMEDMVFCNHLKRLVIDGFPGPGLDAGPLENLSRLKILEWNGRQIIHQESLSRLTSLTELILVNVPLRSLSFLEKYSNLLKFGYSNAPLPELPDPDWLPLIENLTLQDAELEDARFISKLPNLVRLNLSGNQISETSFLSPLSNLADADLSENRIANLLLTDRLQSLKRLDVSGNRIGRITITSELMRLTSLNISNNLLRSPGRLFIYTPNLVDLDLSGNKVRDMGNQRCSNLEAIDASDNQLITVEWLSLQPALKRVMLNRNRISDLSGLLKSDLYKNIKLLDISGNPVSRQSFAECVPKLETAVDTLRIPASYEPLSPCYVTPASGVVMPGTETVLTWNTDAGGNNCLYDVYLVSGDSLVPLATGLGSTRLALENWPGQEFSWTVASRTGDSVYFSGVYDVALTLPWQVPFLDSFETYLAGSPFTGQSGFWMVTTEDEPGVAGADVLSGPACAGFQCLQVDRGGTVSLFAGHLTLPYFALTFSLAMPSGSSGTVEVFNINGTHIRLEFNESDTARLFFNNKFYRSFAISHTAWMEFSLLAHARNNNLHLMMGNSVLFNERWLVPEGKVCTDRVSFSSSGGKMLIDEVKIDGPSAMSVVSPEGESSQAVNVWPNPFEESINVRYSLVGTYTVTISDVAGREVYRTVLAAAASSVYTLSPSSLPAGIYFLNSGLPGARPVKLIRSQPEY